MADDVFGNATRFEDVPARVATAGFSLVEVVVTITLMAVVLVPIMTAVATSVEGIVAAAECRPGRDGVGQRRRPRQSGRAERCDYEIFVDAAVQGHRAGTRVWPRPRTCGTRRAASQPGANPALGGSWRHRWEGVRDPAAHNEQIVKRVTISITSPDGDIYREIQVVKSRV